MSKNRRARARGSARAARAQEPAAAEEAKPPPRRSREDRRPRKDRLLGAAIGALAAVIALGVPVLLLGRAVLSSPLGAAVAAVLRAALLKILGAAFGALAVLSSPLRAVAAAALRAALLSRPARALAWPTRLLWRGLGALVWAPRWWVAVLEVVLMGSLSSRSIACTLLLTHPFAWALAPGARGVAGSLVTCLLAVLAAAFLDFDDDDDDDSGVGAGAGARERTVRVVTAVATATPVAWGLAAAVIRASPDDSLSILAAAVVGCGCWGRVVYRNSQPPSAERQRQQEQEQEQHRLPPPPPGFSSWEEWLWYQSQKQRGGGGTARRGRPQRAPPPPAETTDHLPGKPPPGATDAVVRRVLSARNYLGVLGLHPEGAGGGAGAEAGAGGGRARGAVTRALLDRLDDGEVKAARRALVRLHPDKSPGVVGAKDAFILVTEAYESLCDAEARARYARVLGLG